MWHILTHTTDNDSLLEILNTQYIGFKHYKLKNKNSIVYTFYLSSLLDNTKIKNWNFSSNGFKNNSVIIGINPNILNNRKFVICDRRQGASCLTNKFKVVDTNYNSSKPINFTKINSFINSRIGITNNPDFYRNILINFAKQILIKYLNIKKLNYFSYVDNKFHNLNEIKDITNQINKIKKFSNDELEEYYNNFSKYEPMILDKIYNYDNKINTKFTKDNYISSHEVVIDGPLDLKDINFIMISKTSTDGFKTKLKKLCPDYIKIIEIEPNDFTNYTKRIQKVLEKNSEHIQL